MRSLVAILSVGFLASSAPADDPTSIVDYLFASPAIEKRFVAVPIGPLRADVTVSYYSATDGRTVVLPTVVPVITDISTIQPSNGVLTLPLAFPYESPIVRSAVVSAFGPENATNIAFDSSAPELSLLNADDGTTYPCTTAVRSVAGIRKFAFNIGTYTGPVDALLLSVATRSSAVLGEAQIVASVGTIQSSLFRALRDVAQRPTEPDRPSDVLAYVKSEGSVETVTDSLLTQLRKQRIRLFASEEADKSQIAMILTRLLEREEKQIDAIADISDRMITLQLSDRVSVAATMSQLESMSSNETSREVRDRETGATRTLDTENLKQSNTSGGVSVAGFGASGSQEKKQFAKRSEFEDALSKSNDDVAKSRYASLKGNISRLSGISLRDNGTVRTALRDEVSATIGSLGKSVVVTTDVSYGLGSASLAVSKLSIKLLDHDKSHWKKVENVGQDPPATSKVRLRIAGSLFTETESAKAKWDDNGGPGGEHFVGGPIELAFGSNLPLDRDTEIRFTVEEELEWRPDDGVRRFQRSSLQKLRLGDILDRQLTRRGEDRYTDLPIRITYTGLVEGSYGDVLLRFELIPGVVP